MSKQSFPIDDTDGQKPSTRGFYVILALCLLAVGGVAAVTFSDSLRSAPIAEPEETTAATTAVTTTAAAPVAATPSTTTATTVSTTTTAAPTALYTLPLSHVMLTPFSEQPVFNPTLEAYEPHLAVDFDGEEGQSVFALARGNICRIEDDPLWGDCVTVDHGEGVTSVYRGVECVLTVGAMVESGQEIGRLGAVPCEASLGPHLHLELYQSGAAVDPAKLFSDTLVSRDEINR